MSLESTFGVSTGNDRILIGTTLGDFCLETIITFREKKALLQRIGAPYRIIEEERQRIEMQAKEKLLGMVTLATDDCVEVVLERMKNCGALGRFNYVQKARIRAFNDKVSRFSIRGEEALARFQAEMVHELFQKLNSPVRIHKPLVINLAECNVVTILAAFIDMRPRAEKYIEAALSTKLITRKSEKSNK